MKVEIMKPIIAPDNPKKSSLVLSLDGAKKYPPIVSMEEMIIDIIKYFISITSPQISTIVFLLLTPPPPYF